MSRHSHNAPPRAEKLDRQMADIVTDHGRSTNPTPNRSDATPTTGTVHGVASFRNPMGFGGHFPIIPRVGPATAANDDDDLCTNCGYPAEWCRCFGG